MRTPEEIAKGLLFEMGYYRNYRGEIDEKDPNVIALVAAALRDYGDERASEMRELAAQAAEDEWTSMDHVVGARIAAAIRALPTTPPPPAPQ